MLEKDILTQHNALKNNEITTEELVSLSIKKCHEIQEETNSFVTILDDVKGSNVTDSLLSGIPYGMKDNFSTKGILTTASSNTLKDYIPFYDATVIKKLKEAGAVGVCKTALDEFGMGGTGTTCHTGPVHNPWDKSRIAGGSSAGSAASVASGCYAFALGSDTGDSVRKPAGYCGIVGYKPTYGMISRYGLLPYASSLDTVGVLARTVEDAAIVVDAMKGIDENDMTSWDSKDIHLYESINKEVKGKKLFYIKELVDIDCYENPSEEFKEFLNKYKETIKTCESLGMSVQEESFDSKLLNALPIIYSIISYAEATSNMSNLTGISFGPRGEGNNYIDIMKNHRTNGFSSLIKRRFVIGSYVLQSENQEKYFLNAKRVRRLIVNKMNELFDKYDAMIMPVGTGIAPFLDTTLNDKTPSLVLEESLQIANYGGYPSITIPSGFMNNMPIGINITSKVKNDVEVLNIAGALEDKLGFKGQIVGGEK